MNDLLTVNDTLLDEMFELEAGCEASHTDRDNRACSVEVTHRHRFACGMDKLICSSAAVRNLQAIADDTLICGYCQTPCFDCWTVTPA